MGGCCGVAANAEKTTLPEQEPLQNNGSTKPDIKLPEDDDTKVQSSDVDKSDQPENEINKADDSTVKAISCPKKTDEVSPPTVSTEVTKETGVDTTAQGSVVSNGNKHTEGNPKEIEEIKCIGSHRGEQTTNAVNSESINVELSSGDADDSTVPASPITKNEATKNDQQLTAINGLGDKSVSDTQDTEHNLTSGCDDQQCGEVNGTVEQPTNGVEENVPGKQSPGTEMADNQVQ